MKKYFKELIILIIQLLIFYVCPILLSIVPDNPIGIIFTIILITFILSIILGCISKEKIKYLYPIFVSILFIPSVFIYYNDSALIHSLWYLVVSFIGIGLGTIICKMKK